MLASHDAMVRPDPRRVRRAAHRPGPARRPARLGRPDRRRRDARQDQRRPRTEELVQRYAYIASQPEGQIAKVERSIVGMAAAAALRGAVHRPGAGARSGWRSGRPAPRAARLAPAAGAASWPGWSLVLVVVAWSGSRGAAASRPVGRRERSGCRCPTSSAPAVPVPEQAADLEVRTDVTTSRQPAADRERRRHLRQEQGVLRRRRATPRPTSTLREPEEGDTVVALVSDRHDNIGMDPVARAIADAGGATAVFDAGDDTSTGERWEAFSLDSRGVGVRGPRPVRAWPATTTTASFVTDYLADLGWTMLDGEVVDGPGGSTLLGVDDPRSSGLGNWRDETGLSFAEVGSRLADVACESEERVVDDPRPRRQPRRRGARARLRRPRRRRAPARPGGPDAGDRRERRGRLHLHDRHDRRSGVRHRDRQQAPPRGDDHAADLPRRPPGRASSRWCCRPTARSRSRSYHALILSD